MVTHDNVKFSTPQLLEEPPKNRNYCTSGNNLQSHPDFNKTVSPQYAETDASTEQTGKGSLLFLNLQPHQSQ